MNKKRKLLIKNINNNIGNVLIADKIILLNIISQRVGSIHFYEEGTGVRIRYSRMSNALLTELDELITEMMKKTYIDLSPSKIPSWEVNSA